MTLATFSARAAAVLVAAVAGFASYRHIYDVAIGAGEHRSVASVLPLAIDGLILVATLAMLDDKRGNRRPRLSARVALVFGVLATLAANIASAEATTTARLVAAVPAVSFLLAVEVLARTGKLIEQPAVESVTVTPAASVAVPVVESAGDAKPPVKRARPKALTSEDKVRRAAIKLPAGTVAQIATKAGVSTRTASRHLSTMRAAEGTPPSAPDAAETTVNGQPVDLAGVTS